MNIRKAKSLILLLFSMIIIFSIVSVASIYRSKIYTTLNTLHLIPTPERFTELYFDDHLHLPKIVEVNSTEIFSFTIHNLEGKEMDYPYSVYSKSQTGTTTTELNESIVQLEDGESRTIQESFRLDASSTEEVLFVELLGKHQEIHFSTHKK